MGRPTKLTPEVHNEIVDLIEQGNFAQIAAASVGITEQTYYNWLNRGRNYLTAAPDERADGDLIFAQFFESVKEAEAKAEVAQLAAMNRDDKWQRRAWWLERRFPKRWGQKASFEVSGPDGGPLTVANTAEAAAELEAFLDQRREAIAAAQAALTEE